MNMAAQTLARTPLKDYGHGLTNHDDNQHDQNPSRIPVVSHVIADEDMGILKGEKLQSVNLSKVVKILTDPHSAMLYDRHVHAIQKLVRHYQSGFLMKDLVAIFKILNVCADRVYDNPIYIEPMLDMLNICRLPFLKEKSSDVVSYRQIAIESVSQLGYLMRVPNSEIRHSICSILKIFYSEKSPVKDLQRLQQNSLTYNQKIVDDSDIAETLIKSLALIENDLDIKLAVLSVLQKLTKKFSKNCELVLQANGAHRLCSRLMDYDESGQLLFRSCEILWNLLEMGDKYEVARQLNNLSCIGQLRDAFIHQLTQGYSHYDRQLRNDLLVILSLVSVVSPDAPFLETGLIKQLVLFATFQEVKSHNALVKHLKLSTSYEDLELKKLLVNILVNLSVDSSVIPILSEGRLLLALFSYVKSNEKSSPPREWTIAQTEELQLHAMDALSKLGPIMIDDYMTCQGSTRLLLLLEWCTGPDEFKGQGNSFFGKGGRDNKRAQMRFCLRLMQSMVSTQDEAVLQDFVDQGAIHQLTGILSTMCQYSKPQQDAISIEMQCDMLYILSSLCDGDMHRKELFGTQGVDVLITYLKTDRSLLSGGLGHHRLMLTSVDCIWCAVVGCYVTEDYFLEQEGVFLLIDMLQDCPKNMHNLVLGSLLDLSENSKVIPHINAWRGHDNVSAAHKFCDIWREEEKQMAVPRDEKSGAINDISRPLMGELQKEQGVTSMPASCPSQAIVDVSENMRAKLYALFSKIGFIELSGLTTEDHVTLTIIEHYLDFKLGEVWSEVIGELNQDEIRPVTPDREALEAISRTVEERAVHVQEVQKELLDAQHQQDLIDEQEFYAEIRDNHRQKEKAITDFHDYVARTSNYAVLKAAKEKQDMSIEASRVQNNYKTQETFHNTEISNLQATVFSGRYVNIESTPADLTGGPLANYDPMTGTLKTIRSDPDKYHTLIRRTKNKKKSVKLMGHSPVVVQDNDESVLVEEQEELSEEAIAEQQMTNALSSMNSIDKNDLTELKALSAPPQAVKLVMDAVCILFNIQPEWSKAKALLADANLIERLQTYPVDSVTDKQIKSLKQYLNLASFTESTVKKCSMAAVGLYKWVIAVYDYTRASRKLDRILDEKERQYKKQLLLDMKAS